MRKNILIATVVGLCVIGMTACSRGEENKPANGETTPSTTAMTQEQAPAADQNQAAPASPSAENNVSDAAIAPAQPEVNQVASNTATPDAQTTAPVANPETQTESSTTTTTTTGTDAQGQPTQSTESSTTSTTTPADNNMSMTPEQK